MEPSPTTATDARVPKLADGVELIGEFEKSGFKENPYLVKRSDGQVIQLPELLYLVAAEADGKRTAEEIAERVSMAVERGLDADGVRYLFDEKLKALGIVDGADGSPAQMQRLDPILALKFRFPLVPARAVGFFTALFKPLFWPPVVIAALIALGALDYWLFALHGVGQSFRETIYNPALFLLIFGLIVVSAAFHEVGHATACAYGGAKPGVIGAGLYVAWPAFYTDVTDAYRLGKGARLRTDLGGVYFNVIFSIGTAVAYFATGFEPLLLVILIQQIEILHQFMPFLRLDGYYIISDLTGVPDMFSRIKPILRSMIPWKKTDDTVRELKPWVRFFVTLWVLLMIPLLLFQFGLLAIHAPRFFGTAISSGLQQYDEMVKAFSEGDSLGGLVAILKIVLLAIPCLAIVLTFGRALKRLGSAGWAWSSGRPIRRLVTVALLLSIVGLVAYIWIPNGDYRPIQENENFTVRDAVSSFKYVQTGRPAITPELEAELEQQGEEVSGPADAVLSPLPSPTPSPGTSPMTSPLPSPSPSPSPAASPSPSPSPSP